MPKGVVQTLPDGLSGQEKSNPKENAGNSCQPQAPSALFPSSFLPAVTSLFSATAETIPVPLEPNPMTTATAQMSFLPPGGAGREFLGRGQLTAPQDGAQAKRGIFVRPPGCFQCFSQKNCLSHGEISSRKAKREKSQIV